MDVQMRIEILKNIQIIIAVIAIPVLAYYMAKAIIKIKVNKAVYGTDFKRLVEDKILEKQAKLNRNQDGQS